MENSNIIKTLQEKINILQEMYGHDQSNKKAIIHQLIDTNQKLQEELGKKEIFLRYIGKNNKDFLNFQKIANKKSLDRRMIYTDRNYPIYYYGGTDKEDVTNKLDHIYEYAKKNGVNFKTEDFQKSLILRKDKK